MSITHPILNKHLSGSRWFDAEVARLIVALDAMPPAFVLVLNVRKLYDSLDLAFSYITMIQIIHDYRIGLQENAMAGKPQVDADEQATGIDNQLVLERIARIVTKTYAHKGDDEEIGTEDGMLMIHRELKSYDPSLLVRNEKRRLPKQSPVNS